MSRCTRRMSLLALVVAGAALALALATDQPELSCPPGAMWYTCSKSDTNTFRVRGYSLRLIYEVDKLLELYCDDKNALSLDAARAEASLPRFTPALRVGNVTVSGCPPALYATMLAALNVTLTSPFNLELNDTNDTGKSEPLTAAHLAGLPPLRHLTVRHAAGLQALPASLELLTVEYTPLLDNTLEALPRTLTELRLERVNITRVPAAVLDLPELRSLHVVNEVEQTVVTVERSNVSRLQQLYVDAADGALLSEWAPPALEEVTLENWKAERPNPLPACDKLVKLTLINPKLSKFPAGWVARCALLQELNITGAFIVEELPARLLENVTQLTSFAFQATRQSSLPTQLFAYTPHLTHLDLSNNRLTQLPSLMLTNTALFTELRSLSLAWNPDLGDLCTVNDGNVTGISSLASLPKLERLDLQGTNISMICRDWREDMVNLKYLNVIFTRIMNLTYEDLQYRRHVPAVVELAGVMNFTADDYDRAAAAAAVAAPSHNVTIVLITANVTLVCSDASADYSLYWLTEALHDNLLPLYDVHIVDYLFIDKQSLRKVRAEDRLCPSKKLCVTIPSGCDCGMSGGGLLRVVCVGLKLNRVPQLPSLTADFNAVDLVLSNNSITELDVKDLPPHLRVLDLRNNSISYITEATARALVSGTKRRVLLAGNLLECSCRATPALRVLRDHAAALVGYDALRCDDGRMLEYAIKDGCSKYYMIVITVSLVIVIVVLSLTLWCNAVWGRMKTAMSGMRLMRSQL